MVFKITRGWVLLGLTGVAPLYAQRPDTVSTRTIAADSVVPTAPVTTLSELLTGRVSGVQTLTRDGQVGAGTVAYIQGLSAAAAFSEPLIYIDGIRVDGRAGGDNPAASNPHPGSSRLDDLDPAEIARVDVLTGADAMPLYGPGASNGVILITTKRGAPGGPHWDLLAEGGVSTTPLRDQYSYYAWGQTTPGGAATQCLTWEQAEGQCVIDSTTKFNPLLSSGTTPFGTGYRQRYVASVGGTVPGNVLRYHVSGNYSDETGTLKVPSNENSYYQSAYGTPIPPIVERPNAMDAGGVRGSATADIGHAADITASAGYLANHQRSANGDLLMQYGAGSQGYAGAQLDGWGAQAMPADNFDDRASENAQRVTASTQANWRPASFAHAFATLGVDATDQTAREYYPYPTRYNETVTGTDRQRFTQSTAEGGITFTTPISSLVRGQTTIGGQYLEDHFTERSFTAEGSGYSEFYTLQAIPTRTAGGYVEQTLSIDDALTVVGALRVDKMENRTLDMHATPVNSSIRASWRPLSAVDSSLRVHAAYATGNSFPNAQQTLAVENVVGEEIVGVVGGGGYYEGTVGPPGSVTTRQQDAEVGVGTDIAGGRVSADVSVYDRRTIRALILAEFAYPTSYGYVEGEAPSNVAVVRNRGVEASLSARLIDRPALGWNAALTVYGNQNELVKSAAPVVYTGSVVRSVPGYPLYSVWAQPLKYQDLNHDGVIEPNEVSTTPNTPAAYMGSAVPTRQASFSTGVTLWRGRLRIATLVDYKGGYALPDQSGQLRAAYSEDAADNGVPVPLNIQAANVNQWNNLGSYAGWIQQVNALRWRELSATVQVQRRVDVTVAVRNLALWTNYRGDDPDVDLTVDEGATSPTIQIPQSRDWTLRVHIAM
jgi:TonB-dependent SusC/RagA subfamily outer membrane receptor